ncbi:MAG: MopE-related protein [Myxococcota bacterium]
MMWTRRETRWAAHVTTVAPAAGRLVLAMGLALLTAGCEDDAFCFSDCGEGGSAAQGGGDAASTSSGLGGGFFATSSSTGGGGSECELTNGGIELCDDIDNDCDGEVDEDFDFNGIQHCGTCANNCLTQLLNTDPLSITCTWDGTEGSPGACSFGSCASDYFDLDGDGATCEYFCIQTAADDTDCNNRDDDCDGVKDEDVDLCSDASNCGACGRNCSVVNGTGRCAAPAMQQCTPANTQCEIDTCDDTDNDGLPDFHDLDGLYSTGCEYPCEITNGGIEICGDNLDNDCDGLIDGADNLAGDPAIGQPCFGDPDGLCATAPHQGLTGCVAGQVVCTGANILDEDDVPETCNGIDDDCDGVVDDNPTDAGTACGLSNVFPCTLGAEQCVGGQLLCVGNIDPQPEVCNGADDDCNAVIDDNPIDAGGACNVFPSPPMGATSPCAGGTLSCSGGVLACVGDVGPTSSVDGCNVDANCDGQLTAQPDLSTDVGNCGQCGNDCFVGAVNSDWVCVSSTCQFNGCLPNFFDLDNDQTCEYGPCVVTGSEVCDGIDNDCNGLIDDNLTAPTPVDVCGVSPAATRPECTSGVNVQCSGGSWQCSFPAGVCGPNCASATEVCDNLDNDCDGSFNENVPNFGLGCTSDAGLPAPGHGACQTTGTFVCSGPNATQCSAVKASCTTLPGGCDEACDGVDNDCDGLVDEDYTDKGSDPAHFVRPAVTQVAANLWVFSYEASRPDAGPLTPGNGNGFFCTGAGCPAGIPPAPAGEPLDETIACSVPGVLPWFNVSPTEVEQTCDAIGGFICDVTDYLQACETPAGCTWGYAPRGPACDAPADATKFCNLGAYDFDTSVAGDQDGLLPTGASELQNCGADWSGLFFNTEPTVFDITGNLREVTKEATDLYPLMGGAYNTPSEFGATCSFDFYVVDESFRLLDTGFRCCFSSDPRL